jgi:NAD(P)-dependent dehydrogenase (short-subunit alcohol dehydrogenase family)
MSYAPTPQAPIGSGFGMRSTAEEVIAGVSLAGRTAVVTGGASGIGLETARVLAQAGAKVIVPARSPDKARAALADVSGAEVVELDLLDPASIDAGAETILAAHPKIDILVNCAGVMAAPLMRDGRGYEGTFSANHLGHFQLAARLWPALKASGDARVIAVSSHGHRLAGVNLEDPNFEHRPYEKWSAYGQSKTANILFTVALDQRGAAHGVRAFSLHPGSIVTDLLRHLTPEELIAMGGAKEPLKHGEADEKHKSIPQGASTIVWCATSPQLAGQGGAYCLDCDIANDIAADAWTLEGVVPFAKDPAIADRLWTLSETLTGTPFRI